MHEILTKLSASDWILDLGSSSGSFSSKQTNAAIVRADLDRPHDASAGGWAVQCDADALPFREGGFSAVIANHSLEHFVHLEEALREIRRVLRNPGYLYVSAPDSSSFSDRLYRWLARGGGHVNHFNRLERLNAAVEKHTGLRCVGTRLLLTSLCCLNRRVRTTKTPKRLWLLGGGAEWTLCLASYLFRLSDRFLNTRLSVYGWACYFGADPGVDKGTWSNTCVRCGSGHPSGALRKSGAIRQTALFLPGFLCPNCGALNYYTDDAPYGGLS